MRLLKQYQKLELDDTAKEALLREAYRFLKVGSITLTDWETLDEAEKVAFVHAKELIELEKLFPPDPMVELNRVAPASAAKVELEKATQAAGEAMTGGVS